MKKIISAEEAFSKSNEALKKLEPVLDFIDMGIEAATKSGIKELILKASSPIPIERRIFSEPGLREDVTRLLQHLGYSVNYVISMDPGDSSLTISWDKQ